MNADIQQDWIGLCGGLGLEPDEVRIVSRRYDMYKSYTDAGKNPALPLGRWYTWYRVEKLSEGHASLTPPASGCSVDAEASGREEVISEADFLRLMMMYRETTRS